MAAPSADLREASPVKVVMGTCGWSDVSLLRCGKFYPSSVRSAEDRLRHYATFFPCVEVDTSTYAIPSLFSVSRWVQSVPKGFKFHFKAFGLFCSKSCSFSALPADAKAALTSAGIGGDFASLASMPGHVQKLVWDRFNNVLDVANTAGNLGVVVFQFHLSFKPSESNRRHVEWCRKFLDARFSMAVEFRDRDWVVGPSLTDTCHWLSGLGIALIAADELKHETFQRDREQTGLPAGQLRELMPLAWGVTSPDFFYVRVHRREGSKRLLSESEIEAWVKRLQGLKHYPPLMGPIYFMWGTDHEDQPILNAKQLSRSLGDEFCFNWKHAIAMAAKSKGGSLACFFHPREKAVDQSNEDRAMVDPLDESHSLDAVKTETVNVVKEPMQNIQSSLGKRGSSSMSAKSPVKYKKNILSYFRSSDKPSL